MVVRDESETLERAINSVKKICSEIIIAVDPRSVDNTFEIAKRYAKSKAYYFDVSEFGEDEIDFAKVRNDCLAKSNCAWNIIIDGDEFYAPNHYKLIKRAIDRLDKDGVRAIGHGVFLELDKYGNPMHVGGGSRLIKRGVSYVGKQHNHINEKVGVYITDIVLIHDKAKSKVGARNEQRNKLVPAAMLKAIEEDPTNKRAIFYMAVQAFSHQEWEEAIKWQEKYLELPRDLDETRWDEEYQIRIQLAQSLGNVEKYQEAIDVLHICGRLNWRRCDHFNILSYLSYKIGEVTQDSEHAKMSLQFSKIAATFPMPDKLNQFVNYGMYSWIPYYNMMYAYSALGMFADATTCAKSVLQYKPNDPEILECVSKMKELQKDGDEYRGIKNVS